MRDTPRPDDTGVAAEFTAHERLLWGLAYRMLGTAQDADDVVQDTFVRLLRSPPPSDHGSLRRWLVRVAMNLARDQLRRRKTRGYVGPWLPGPVPSDDARMSELPETHTVGPEARYSLLESLSFGFLIAAEKLTPSQRAVMVLRDVFGRTTTETAVALDMSESNVRVSLHRARQTMQVWEHRQRRRLDAPHERVLEAMTRFVTAIGAGDVEGAERMLARDVVLLSDGGGEFFTTRKPVVGAAKVALFYSRLSQMYEKLGESSDPQLRYARPMFVNGQCALDVGLPKSTNLADRAVTVFELDDTGRIAAIHSVLTANKLAAVPAGP